MSQKANGVNFGKTEQQKSRRERVIPRLEAQLKTGMKMPKSAKEGITKLVPLTDADIKRINKEIATLKARL